MNFLKYSLQSFIEAKMFRFNGALLEGRIPTEQVLMAIEKSKLFRHQKLFRNHEALKVKPRLDSNLLT